MQFRCPCSLPHDVLNLPFFVPPVFGVDVTVQVAVCTSCTDMFMTTVMASLGPCCLIYLRAGSIYECLCRKGFVVYKSSAFLLPANLTKCFLPHLVVIFWFVLCLQLLHCNLPQVPGPQMPQAGVGLYHDYFCAGFAPLSTH